MNINTVRYYLHDMEDIDEQIIKLRKEIKELKEMEIDSITIQIITDMPICHTGESKVETVAIRRLEQIEKKEGKLFEMLMLRDKIEESLEEIKEDTAIDYIIKERYDTMQKKTLKEIAKIHNYGLQSIKNADSRFMKKVISKIKNLNTKY